MGGSSPRGRRRRSAIAIALRPRISFTLPTGTSADELPAPLAARATRQSDGRFVLEGAPIAAALHALSGWALEHDIELDDLEVRRPTLEDIYLEQTSHHDRRPS